VLLDRTQHTPTQATPHDTHQVPEAPRLLIHLLRLAARAQPLDACVETTASSSSSSLAAPHACACCSGLCHDAFVVRALSIGVSGLGASAARRQLSSRHEALGLTDADLRRVVWRERQRV
jgi:hypothetical protein